MCSLLSGPQRVAGGENTGPSRTDDLRVQTSFLISDFEHTMLACQDGINDVATLASV